MRAWVFLVLAVAGFGAAAAPSPAAPAPAGGVLTNAAQIRRLTAAQAAGEIPVKLRGVVIDESEPREHAVILSDGSASLYLHSETNLFAPYHRQDLLEVSGYSSQGQFAPCVVAAAVQKTGYSALPPAQPVTYQQLVTGALDAQFVQITGVVRECWPARAGDTTWRIVLAADGGDIPVRIPLPQRADVQADAEVTIEAVCLYEFNRKRQAISPVLQVPHGLSARIVKPAPADPYATPPQTLASLLQFSSEVLYGHRIHVRGVVISTQPRSLVWIRDASSSLRIQTLDSDDLQPGDEIDVLGFPGYGTATPVLEDATYRKVGRSSPPAPLLLTDLPEATDHQDDLVCLDATLAEVHSQFDGLLLVLDRQGTGFNAVLKRSTNQAIPAAWQPGSVLRVAGICDVIYDSSKPVMGIWHPQSIQILLRSPGDVTVLQAPSWWNARHVVFVLGLCAAASLVATGGVILLARRRLHEQARRRAMAEAEFAAILTERNRLAREIHDTLAQGYTATLLQLQLVELHAAGNHEAMARHLDKAKQMIRESLKEARNSIWEMQPQVLETGDLVSALKNILKQLSDGVVPHTQFEVTGHPRRFSPMVENNILRLGQEAITNAIKHSRAGQISVRLHFAADCFRLQVVDDGQGFDPAQPPASEGGFGLVGMQGRAKELNAELQIHSRPAQGTEVSLQLALPAESPQTG